MLENESIGNYIELIFNAEIKSDFNLSQYPQEIFPVLLKRQRDKLLDASTSLVKILFIIPQSL